jgi:NADH dehydrogenase [ubiquinone] 1 alpha subcomplex assembly factor 7
MAQRPYYAARDPFGSAGDFVTAPEISQMFGERIGWIADLAGRPVRLAILRLSNWAGRGTLMRDALRVMDMVPPIALRQ